MNRTTKLLLVGALVLLVMGAAFFSSANAALASYPAPIAANADALALQPPPTVYTLTMSFAGGSVNLNPFNPTRQYISGTVVTLTALPDSGWAFVHWTGDIGSVVSTTNPITVAMTMNRSITAVFTQQQTPTTQPTNSPTPTPSRTATRTFTPTTATSSSTSSSTTSSSSSSSSSTTSSSVSLATITPLLGGVVATATRTPTPTSALPSTGLPLTWLVVGLVLVMIVVGARYLRQNSI